MNPHRSAIKVVILTLILMCAGCAPAHTVKPLPDFVDKAIQPGDKVIVTTTAGDTIEFEVKEVANETLIGKDYRVALADIVTLKKVSWKRPASPSRLIDEVRSVLTVTDTLLP